MYMQLCTQAQAQVHTYMYSAGHSQLDIRVRGTRVYCGVLVRVKLRALDTVPRAPLNVVHAPHARTNVHTYVRTCTRTFARGAAHGAST